MSSRVATCRRRLDFLGLRRTEILGANLDGRRLYEMEDEGIRTWDGQSDRLTRDDHPVPRTRGSTDWYELARYMARSLSRQVFSVNVATNAGALMFTLDFVATFCLY